MKRHAALAALLVFACLLGDMCCEALTAGRALAAGSDAKAPPSAVKRRAPGFLEASSPSVHDKDDEDGDEAEEEAEAEAEAEVAEAESDAAEAAPGGITGGKSAPMPKDVSDITEDTEKDKPASEEKKEKEEKKKQEEKPAEKPAEEEADADDDAAAAPAAAPAAEAPPAPEAPFEHAYDHADEVVRDVELRGGAEFFPEGTHSKVDVPENEQHRIDSLFDQDPSIYGNCMLIRDFAEPLRVGSSIMERARDEGTLHVDGSKLPHGLANLAAQRKPSSSGEANSSLPGDLLLAKGAVADVDPEDGELQINMFAFLRSIAGEVPVIPNGIIARWGSKKRVPIAGYLCTGPSGPVLHTLDTPCLPTAVGDDGEAYLPPANIFRRPAPAAAAPAPAAPSAEAPPDGLKPKDGAAAPAAAPAAASEPPADEADAAAAEAEAEAEEAAKEAEAEAEAGANKTEGASLLVRRRLRRQGASAAPAPAPAAGPSEADSGYRYNVWVGGRKLAFTSKPKADRFCKRLAEKIATDLGDTEWDSELMPVKEAQKPNPSLKSFVQVARAPSKEWTLGKKTVLVVVMDWMEGDQSSAPLSHQTKTPEHYRDKIFPRVADAFRRMSYGKFEIEVTVLPTILRYTRQRVRYKAEGYPFPGLYNGARSSMAGNAKYSQEYNFDNFDLVYVISPQQAPKGTKGVAYVGAKAAMCNGCEAISDNFQVMVAVHELGHNLGLSHASSTSLEYGNVYDWMGNYPDVQGLSYGLGYKLMLNWLPTHTVAEVNDAALKTLNDEYILQPYDVDTPPADGQLVGLRFRLKNMKRDLYVAFRDTNGKQAGIYLTWQERDRPNSELIDCACNSPSQQDSRLQQGWTYMDPDQKFVIYVKDVTDAAATIHVYKAPSDNDIAAIRARSTFTDGFSKCPRVCTDSDLLVSTYKDCASLGSSGYCTRTLSFGGRKYNIGTELCPKTCDKCEEVLHAPAEDNCGDRNVKISGMNCKQAAAGGYCDYSTGIGHIGTALCPQSCGKCPPRSKVHAEAGSHFRDPSPVKFHGVKGERPSGPTAEHPSATSDDDDDDVDDDSAGTAASGGEDEADGEDHCTDDAVWTDGDQSGCQVYADYIAKGTLTKEEACEYEDGQAKVHCRKTCGTCDIGSSDTCADKDCVTRFWDTFGKCIACGEWKAMCAEPGFRADCPYTCGVCSESQKVPKKQDFVASEFLVDATTVTTTTTPDLSVPPPICADHDCVDAWLNKTGKCHRCSDHAQDFCGRDADFMASCPKTCKLCDPKKEPVCEDAFKAHTCKRLSTWGLCRSERVLSHCKASCGVCKAAADAKKSHEETSKEKHREKSGARDRQPMPAIAMLIGLILVCLSRAA